LLAPSGDFGSALEYGMGFCVVVVRVVLVLVLVVCCASTVRERRRGNCTGSFRMPGRSGGRCVQKKAIELMELELMCLHSS
jgi:hypothetical protein